MDTTIKEGYVRKGKVLGKSMKKRYLVLRSASEKSRTGQLEFYDDQKQVKKKPTNVISVTSVAGVNRIEAPLPSGASLREGGYFIRLDIRTEKEGLEELYLGVETRELFEEWLTDLEFLVRLPDLVIPLSIHPKREVPLTKQTIINKKIFGHTEFEDACPVEVLQTELGLKWQFTTRYFILVLTRSTLVFIDPETDLRALTYPIQNLRRCGHWQKLVFIESGRRTDTGPGYLWMFVHSKVLAKSFYSTLSNVMGSTYPMLVTQRYLCWDKFREELPPGSVDQLTDLENRPKGPISDNQVYLTSKSFDPNSLRTDLIQPLTRFNTPPLPPNHPTPMTPIITHFPAQVPPSIPSTNKYPTPSRKDDTELPPLPTEASRRASLPIKVKLNTDKTEAALSSRPDNSSPKSKRQTVSSGEKIKSRYDMLVIDDTQDLKVRENGQVVTKISHAVTDGKGNVLKEQSTPPSHSYYDVNEMISKLTMDKKSSPSLGRKQGKHNTISTRKLTDTTAKEKIGNSTFYKGSLPINNPNIAPYAEFSDLETQIPADIRRERLRLLSIKDTRSMENPSETGTPLLSNPVAIPLTPQLYASPQNIPVDSVYKLVDPKPRPITSDKISRSLPEDFSPEENPIYNVPSSSEYQRPSNNLDVPFTAAGAGQHEHETKIIITEKGDYDRLSVGVANEGTEDPRANSISYRTPSPCYEEMVSARKTLSENKPQSTQSESGELGDVTFSFQPPDNPHPLNPLVESQVMESSPLQQERAPPSISQTEDTGEEANNSLYEVMTDLSKKKSPSAPTRYFNIPPSTQPQRTESPATPPKSAAVMGRRESSPQVNVQPKPVLSKAAKSFGFRSSSTENCMYYAQLDLENATDATIILNAIHSNDPPTQYDKIDHKVSKILNDTVQQHRETK